jgi:hypothetical protein
LKKEKEHHERGSKTQPKEGNEVEMIQLKGAQGPAPPPDPTHTLQQLVKNAMKKYKK